MTSWRRTCSCPTSVLCRSGRSRIREAAYAGPFHRLSIWPAVACQVSVALGVARAAIDDFIAMATKKTPMYTATPLRERSVVQLQVAEAEAKLGAARCFLFSVLDEVWQRAKEGQSLDMSARARRPARIQPRRRRRRRGGRPRLPGRGRVRYSC